MHSVEHVREIATHAGLVRRQVRDGLASWLTERDYESLDQARGSMSQESCPEPAAFERANYMKLVHDYQPPAPAGG